MSGKDILHEHLLLGKIVTVCLPSPKDIASLRSTLTTAKRRLEESSARFGFPSGTEGQSICTELVGSTENEYTYKIWLGIKKKKTNYTIVDISTSETDTNKIEGSDML